MQEDTYTGDIKDPLTLNLYTYCANNPITYIDPSGHAFTDWDKKYVTRHEDREAIQTATREWIEADKRGDEAGKRAAHIRAEAVRNKYRGTDFVGRADGTTVRKQDPKPVAKKSTDKVKSKKDNSKRNSSYVAVGVVGTEVISAPWEYPEIGGLTTVKKATPIGIGLTILFTPSKAGETEEDLKNDAEFQKAIAGGGTGDPNNRNKKKKDKKNSNKKANIDKVDDRYLKKKGIDAHELKKDYLGDKAKISHYDIYVDKMTKQLWIFEKGGQGIGTPTHIFIR